MSSRQQADSDDLRRSERSPDAGELRRRLSLLPKRQPSADLEMRLKVLASRESARQRSRYSWKQLWDTRLQDFRLQIDNLMRPLAIPTAGGFVSALLLFAVLAPSLVTRGVAEGATAGVDIPTVLYTEASVRSFIPFGFNDEDLLVEVTIDGDGRVIDYELPNGDPKDPELHRSLENYLLFTQFTPVRNFGQPVRAKVRISFQSSRIEVRG